MVRLLVDHSAGFSQGAGIGRYARNVVPQAVAALDGWDVTLMYASASRSPEPFQAAALAGFPASSRIDVRRVPLSRKRLDQLWFRARCRLPVEPFAGQSDVVYSPDFTTPPTFGRQPRFVTVHDLAFLVVPRFAPAGLRAFLGRVVPREVTRAALVGVVSESTRIDVMERLGVESERIVLVPNGVDDRFFGPAPLTHQRRSELGLPDEYLLTVGTIEPRKNHLTLFRALEILEPRLDLPLIVAGRPGWSYSGILAASRELEIQKRVIRLDYVPDTDLPGLYAGAAAVVYPSWYEGFGLPVLEAMATGTPVVSSDAPALIEVGGGSTLTVPPGSAEAIADAIERAVSREGMAPAAVEARVQRARRYRWEASGSTLAVALRQLGGPSL